MWGIKIKICTSVGFHNNSILTQTGLKSISQDAPHTWHSCGTFTHLSSKPQIDSLSYST